MTNDHVVAMDDFIVRMGARPVTRTLAMEETIAETVAMKRAPSAPPRCFVAKLQTVAQERIPVAALRVAVAVRADGNVVRIRI